MASYHLSSKIIGRSDNRSAVACAAYRAGTHIKRDEDDKHHKYDRKGGVVSADLLTPGNAPAWARDRSQLWNAVEAKENRKNSQFARELIVALPHELSQEQSREMLLVWAKVELVDRGMCADVCIHDPDTSGKNKNRHAHIMCTVREFDENGDWSRTKNREWNDKKMLKSWRESWSVAQNAALKKVGSAETVDHRSLKDQRAEALEKGDTSLAELLDRPPEPRLGLAAGVLEKRAAETLEILGAEYVPFTRKAQRLHEVRRLRSRLLKRFAEIRSKITDPFRDVSQVEDTGDDPAPGL